MLGVSRLTELGILGRSFLHTLRPTSLGGETRDSDGMRRPLRTTTYLSTYWTDNDIGNINELDHDRDRDKYHGSALSQC